jgi:hypothetical protein
MKIMDKLSTYAALIGVIGAIGGGFYAWGEFNNRLSVLENEPPVNLQPLKQKDKDLTKQFDEVLLYANEYKVDLIDRIKKVDDKIKPVDLTVVFKEIAKLREEVAMLDIPDDIDLKPISKELKRLSEELVRIVATIPKVVNLKPLEEAVQAIEKALAIVKKENEVQDAVIEEIKLKSNNPLAN